MRKRYKKVFTIIAVFSVILCFANNSYAAEAVNNYAINDKQQGPPTVFAKDATPEEILAEIEAYYSSLSLTRTGEKWGESETVWDGEVGYYITTRFWVAGSNISPVGLVGIAQTNAVKSKYGSVSSAYDYKLETTQHIVETEHQTQGQITISAECTCYGRR